MYQKMLYGSAEDYMVLYVIFGTVVPIAVVPLAALISTKGRLRICRGNDPPFYHASIVLRT